MNGRTGKVLFISPQPFFEWRGSPIRVGYTVLALAELGYEVDLLTMPVGEERQIPGVRVLRASNWFGVKRLPIGPSFWKAILDIFLLFQAVRLARRNRYDAIQGVEEAGVIAVIAAKLAGGSREATLRDSDSTTPRDSRRAAKVIFEKHSDPFSYRRGPLRNLILWLYSRVEAYTIRRADAVIATGPGLVRQVQEVRGDVPIHHIFDIPSSLLEADPERTRQVRSALLADTARAAACLSEPAGEPAGGDQTGSETTAPSAKTLVMYVGSFAVYQGVGLIFEAILVVARERDDVRFVIIGGSRRQIDEVLGKLAAHGAAGAATFIGKVPPDELPDYLAAADILLSPRIAGSNTPLKVLDYLKAGRPIVATNSEANRLILDDTTAVLVEPNAESFAAAICQLAENEEQRSQLGARGRQLIRETYNFDQFNRRLAACYEGLGSS